MKVYVVESGEYSDRCMVGVYTDLDLAQENAINGGSSYGSICWDSDITEWDTETQETRDIDIDEERPSAVKHLAKLEEARRKRDEARVANEEIARLRVEAYKAAAVHDVFGIVGLIDASEGVSTETEYTIKNQPETALSVQNFEYGDGFTRLIVSGMDQEQVRKVYSDRRGQIIAEAQGLT